MKTLGKVNECCNSLLISVIIIIKRQQTGRYICGHIYLESISGEGTPSGMCDYLLIFAYVVHT